MYRPDPCYCEQAIDYENILTKISEVLKQKDTFSKDKLVNEIQETICKYQEALRERQNGTTH